MAKNCLNKEESVKILRQLKADGIDTLKLDNMGTEGRKEYFKKALSDEAADMVNLNFEKTILLKHRERGVINWIKKIESSGEKVDKKARTDIFNKIRSVEKVMSPATEKEFYADLVKTKLGMRTSWEEAKNILDLSNKVSNSKKIMSELPKTEPGDYTKEQMNYGRAYIAFTNYFNAIKHESMKTPFWAKMGDKALHPLKEIILPFTGASKSLKSTLDFSAILRQSWKLIFNHPFIWARNSIQSIEAGLKELGGKKVLDELNAYIVSRPSYALSKIANLATGTIEEAYPNQMKWIKATPILGRIYKVSETAYTLMLHKSRIDVFEQQLKWAKRLGQNIDDPKVLKAIGSMVNTMTGRASLGKGGGLEALVNNVFFSPRLMVSNMNFLTAQLFDPAATAYVKAMAAKNLALSFTGAAATLKIADTLHPGIVPWDKERSIKENLTSSGLGKLKEKSTFFDVTGGTSGYVILASRIAQQQKMNAITGDITDMADPNMWKRGIIDELNTFFKNKSSPAAMAILNYYSGKDFQGNPPTLSSVLIDLYVPLPVTSAVGAMDPNRVQKMTRNLPEELALAITNMNNPDSAYLALILIAEGFGANANTWNLIDKQPEKPKRFSRPSIKRR